MMKSFVTLLAMIAFAMFATTTALAADDVAPKNATDETPEKAVEDPAPEGEGETVDLEAENAQLKEKVKSLEAEVKKLTPAPKPPPPPPNHWLFKFNLDLSYFTGNVEKTLLSDALYLKYDSLKAWNLVLQTTHTLVMDDDDITDQYGYFMANFEYAFTPMLATYAFTKHGWHESQKMIYYGNVGAGGIWTFLKDPIDPKAVSYTHLRAHET